MSEEALKKNAVQHTVYKTSQGKRVPSVTTILNVIAKPNLIKWANGLGLQGIDSEKYKTETARAGTLGHQLIQEYMGGPGYAPDLKQFTGDQIESAEVSLKNYRQWCMNRTITPLNMELYLVSDTMMFGGTLDLYADIDGKKWLVDFKTGKGIYPEYEVQVAAYRYLLEEHEMKVDGARILRMGREDEGGFEDHVISEVKMLRAWSVFEAALDLYRAKQDHERTMK